MTPGQPRSFRAGVYWVPHTVTGGLHTAVALYAALRWWFGSGEWDLGFRLALELLLWIVVLIGVLRLWHGLALHRPVVVEPGVLIVPGTSLWRLYRASRVPTGEILGVDLEWHDALLASHRRYRLVVRATQRVVVSDAITSPARRPTTPPSTVARTAVAGLREALASAYA